VEAQLSHRLPSLRKKWIFASVPAACLCIEIIFSAALYTFGSNQMGEENEFI
jgi:hypothetical protein